MQEPTAGMSGEFHMLEPAVRAGLAEHGHAVLIELALEIQERLEVGLADEGSAIAGLLVQVTSHARRVHRQRHAVHPHAVGADILPGQHRRPRRHAHHVLVVSAGVANAIGRQSVDHRRARDRAAITAERVIAHLIGGNEENLSSHTCSWLCCLLLFPVVMAEKQGGCTMVGSFEDKFAIQELVSRYNHAIDFGNYEAWVECFTEDGIFNGSAGRFAGQAELKKFTEQFKTTRANLPNVRHCVMNTVTDVEGDTAISSSYLQLLTTSKEGAKIMFSGRYDDQLVRVGGKWRFKERKVTRDTPPAA